MKAPVAKTVTKDVEVNRSWRYCSITSLKDGDFQHPSAVAQSSFNMRYK